MQGSRTADSLRDTVVSAQAAIKAAQDASWQARRAAEIACDKAQAPARTELSALEREFNERALELAVEEDRCPCNHWGGDLKPDEYEVTPEGILLTWDINGNYAPAYFVATWDALLAPTPALEGTEQ